MKVKVSDYIAKFLTDHQIRTVFTVVGGGAMHLNDSLGHHPALKSIYHHHEQAASMAAEAYFRIHNEVACLCVTSGPGAINALNGVAGAYQDSIPILVLSGQCKTSLMSRYNEPKLRTLGPQEFDIVSALDPFTKYAETIRYAEDIRYCLEKAYYTALTGRPGPCWLEVPLDIQGTYVELEKLKEFTPEDESYGDSLDDSILNQIVEKLKKAQRPVLYAGNGIRIAKAVEAMHYFVKKTRIPVVTCWNSIDLIATNDPYYVGRAGTMGDRPGNFAVQNSDFLLVVGSRLNTYQVGYNLASWAREAWVTVVDIDENELKKKTIRVDLPICADAKEFLDVLNAKLENETITENKPWMFRCREWKKKYPVVSDVQKKATKPLNVYGVIDKLSRSFFEPMITVVANGSASVVGSQSYYIHDGDRFIMNCAISSMGYDLPAAIGACVAANSKPVVCIAGDGSIQMNLQELQTIVTNHLPIRIVVINNEGYQQIRLTQTNLFEAHFVGVGPVSGDLGFPDFGKLADAYGIPYRFSDDVDTIEENLKWLNSQSSYCMLEVKCDTKQVFEPKSATKRMPDGGLVSPPLEDLAPFLPEDELKENMIIDMWEK